MERAEKPISVPAGQAAPGRCAASAHTSHHSPVCHCLLDITSHLQAMIPHCSVLPPPVCHRVSHLTGDYSVTREAGLEGMSVSFNKHRVNQRGILTGQADYFGITSLSCITVL